MSNQEKQAAKMKAKAALQKFLTAVVQPTKEDLMQNQLEVRVETVYGLPKVYPVNAQAKKLAELLGTKTFTPFQMKAAKELGFVFVPVASAAQQALAGVL